MAREVKVVVIGAGGVGKSSIVIQYIQNCFVEEYDPTIEDSYRKQATIDSQTVLLDILDTAGQEEFSAMRDQVCQNRPSSATLIQYMRTGEAFLITYSINDRQSFDEISQLWDQILRVKDTDACPVVLCANKTDLESERVVSTQEGADYAKFHLHCPFFESSAKSRSNIDELFESLARQVLSTESAKKKTKAKKVKRGKKKVLKVKKLKKKAPQHTDLINMITLGQDGHRLFSASRDKTARIWDVDSGACEGVLAGPMGHTEAVMCLALSDTGSIFTGSRDKTIIEWTLDTCLPQRVFKGHAGPVMKIVVVNHVLFSGSRDATVKSWSIEQGRHLRTFSSDAVDLNDLMIVNDSLYVASSDRVVRVFAVSTGELMSTWEGHTSYVLGLAMCPHDSAHMYTLGADATVKQWRLSDGLCERTFVGHEDVIASVAFLPGDGPHPTWMFTGSRDGTLRLFDCLADAKDVRCIRVVGLPGAPVRAVACAGGLLFSSAEERTVRAYDPENGKELWGSDTHDDWVTELAVDSAGNRVFSASRDGTLRCWSPSKTPVIVHVYGSASTRLKGQIMPKVNALVGWIKLLVETLQFMSFAFVGSIQWPDLSGNSEGGGVPHPGSVVLPAFQLNFNTIDFDVDTFTAKFWAVVVWVCVFVVLFLSGFKLVNLKTIGGKWSMLWNLSSVMCHLSSSLLFIPIVNVLVGVVACDDDGMVSGSDGSLQCWTGVHWVYVGFSLMSLIPFLPISLRLAGVDGDINRISLYKWRDWTHDKPELRNIHAFSLSSIWFNRAGLLIKALLSFVVVAITGKGREWTIANASVQLFLILLLTVVAALFPPFHDNRVSSSRFAITGAILWTQANALAAATTSVGPILSILHLSLLPLVIVVFYIGMWAHLLLKKKRRANQAAKLREELASKELIEIPARFLQAEGDDDGVMGQWGIGKHRWKQDGESNAVVSINTEALKEAVLKAETEEVDEGVSKLVQFGRTVNSLFDTALFLCVLLLSILIPLRADGTVSSWAIAFLPLFVLQGIGLLALGTALYNRFAYDHDKDDCEDPDSWHGVVASWVARLTAWDSLGAPLVVLCLLVQPVLVVLRMSNTITSSWGLMLIPAYVTAIITGLGFGKSDDRIPPGKYLMLWLFFDMGTYLLTAVLWLAFTVFATEKLVGGAFAHWSWMWVFSPLEAWSIYLWMSGVVAVLSSLHDDHEWVHEMQFSSYSEPIGWTTIVTRLLDTLHNKKRPKVLLQVLVILSVLSFSLAPFFVPLRADGIIDGPWSVYLLTTLGVAFVCCVVLSTMAFGDGFLFQRDQSNEFYVAHGSALFLSLCLLLTVILLGARADGAALSAFVVASPMWLFSFVALIGAILTAIALRDEEDVRQMGFAVLALIIELGAWAVTSVLLCVQVDGVAVLHWRGVFAAIWGIQGLHVVISVVVWVLVEMDRE